MMLNCRELERIVASDEIVEAAWPRKLGARVHLLMCRHCRRYAAELRAIGAGARRSWGAEARDPGRLEQLERKILGRFPKGSPDSSASDN